MINIKNAVQQTGEHHIYRFFPIISYCFKSAVLPLSSYWGKKIRSRLVFEIFDAVMETSNFTQDITTFEHVVSFELRI